MSTHHNQPPQRRTYDDGFKRDAVNRVLRTGKSCAEVSRELGIPGNILSRWKREFLELADQSTGPREVAKPSELAEQLRLAQQEVEDLRVQRDILKKALSIFSQAPNDGGR